MSTTYLERSRSGCALHGALATFGAINGVAPIIHGTAGCGIHYQHGITPSGGALPACSRWGAPLSSSNITEKHVVFGGGSRLREQLKNTVKVVGADLYAVVTGCATEMVGDDIPAMTREGRDQGFPVIYANTPGFAGSAHRGYEQAVRALIELLPGLGQSVAAEEPTVNVWGIIPQQDVFWQGHLLQLQEMASEVGIRLQPLFGTGQSIAAWQQLPNAALNLVVSPWGRSAADLLQEKYGIPQLRVSGLPVGPAENTSFLEELARSLKIEDTKVASVSDSQNAQFRDHLARIAPTYFSAGFQRDFSIVGELSLVAGIAGFLTNTLGMIPKLAVVTDPLLEDERVELAAALQQTLDPFGSLLAFSEDAAEIVDLIEASNTELILGSSLERELAERLDVPFLPISFPLSGRLVINRGYVGYRGALSLIEDLGSAILSHEQNHS